MPKLSLLRLLLCLCTYPAIGQNLVTNPGFEIYNNCPTGRGQILQSSGYDTFSTATDWVNPTNTSPDYFNRCGSDSSIRLPFLSIDGFHEPRNGNACAGIAMFSGNPLMDTLDYWSEYLETRLSAPLIAGHNYFVSYYVCLTYHGRETYNIISVDHIGAGFTDHMVDTVSRGPMFYMTGVENISTAPGEFITDTAHWTMVSGTYLATGNEQWLTIGRFYTGTIDFIVLHNSASQPLTNHCVCYMLVDDVCVTDMEHVIGADTIIYSPVFPVSIGAGSVNGKYLWSNGDISLETQIPTPGQYIRQRWADCSYYADTFIVNTIPAGSCVWLPSAFTPNNDGKNDLFSPGNGFCDAVFQNFNFCVYNRWGQLVFQTHTPGQKWNGTFNGTLVETGTYFYTLQYDFNKNFSVINNNSLPASSGFLKGDVMLIR